MNFFSHLASTLFFIFAGFAYVLAGDGGLKVLEGSFLEQLQERDSILVADQMKYGFRLENVQEGTGFALPDFSKGFLDSIEIVSPLRLDTLEFRKGRRGALGTYDLEGSMVITSFDEGEYHLPSLSVLRHKADGVVDTLVFEPKSMLVRSMPVDTASFKVHDIKGQVRYPLTFKELLPYLIGTLLLSLAIFLLVRYIRNRREKGSGYNQRKEPAHIVALRKLDHLRGNKLWAQDKQKLFYSGVTDTLREYIASRYGIPAMEMTTKEIFDGLVGKEVPADLYAEVKDLFERADFVKFAKYVAGEDENASAVPVAVRFVTQTYQAELDSEADDRVQPDDSAVETKQ